MLAKRLSVYQIRRQRPHWFAENIRRLEGASPTAMLGGDGCLLQSVSEIGGLRRVSCCVEMDGAAVRARSMQQAGDQVSGLLRTSLSTFGSHCGLWGRAAALDGRGSIGLLLSVSGVNNHKQKGMIWPVEIEPEALRSRVFESYFVTQAFHVVLATLLITLLLSRGEHVIRKLPTENLVD